MTNLKFLDGEFREMYEEKCKKYEGVLEKKVDNMEYLWNETVCDYATKISQIRNVLSCENIKHLVPAKLFKEIDMFLERCSEAEFHIALVGAIKAGKSTLVNALLGYELASTNVTPETAALTKFKKGNENYIKVKFYKKKKWDELWKSAVNAKATVFLEEYQQLNADAEKAVWLDHEEKTIICETIEKMKDEIMKWTSSKSICHYFVEEVEIGLKNFDLPEGIVLVDTPGLDDVVEFRSNITKRYISMANAVLVCVKSDALTGQEMETIYNVFANSDHNKSAIYILATQTDTLNSPEEDWANQKQEWVKYLKEKIAFGDVCLAEKNIVPVSAYLYTLLKDYCEDRISEEDKKFRVLMSTIYKFEYHKVDDASDYNRLLTFTNIDWLKRRINDEIVSNCNQFLLDDIVNKYDDCKKSIIDAMQVIKKIQEDIIASSTADITDIRAKKEEYQRRYDEAVKDKKDLEVFLLEVQKVTTEKARELENAIIENVK